MNIHQNIRKRSTLRKPLNLHSLKSKMILFIGLIILALSIGMGLISYQISSRVLTQNIKDMLPEIATEAALLLENNIAAGFIRMETIANDIKNIQISEEEEASKLKIWKVKGDYLLLGMADSDGVLITSDHKKINIKDMAIYQKAFQGEAAVSEPISDTFGITGLTEGSLVVVYAYPLKAGGKVSRVLIGVKSGNEFSTLVNDISFGKSGEAFMINEAGDIIAHNNLSLVYDKINYIQEADQDISFQQLSKMLSLMKNGESGAADYSYYGVKKIAGYAPVGSTGWSIAVSGEYRDLLSGLSDLRQNSITYTIVFMLMGIIGIFLLANSITKGLIVIADTIRFMSNGDLTQDIPQKYRKKNDEIGILADSLFKMQGALRLIIEDIKYSSSKIDDYAINLSDVIGTVTDATDNVTVSMQDIAKGSGEQAEEFIKIMEGLNHFSEELENMVQLISHVDQDTISLRDLTEASNDKMRFMASSSQRMNETFQSFIDKFSNLGENIQKVNEISNFINEIADQTDLLALNAAIEAARAGEAGKGFAVVADHIRSLADQTKSSSIHINTIIQGIGKLTGNMVVGVKALNKELDQQIEILHITMKSFEAMIDAFQKFAPEIRAVNTSAHMIDNEKNRIIGKVEGVAVIAQQTSAATEEVAASAEEMNASMDEIMNATQVLTITSRNMQEHVERFKLE
jgi:methyl-accepting chemotaxis protein